MARSNSETDAAPALLRFINESPTPYHAVEAAAQRLAAQGFPEQRFDRRWDEAETRGFVRVGDGALAAFDLGGWTLNRGLTVLAAHTDSPALRIREQGVGWRKGCLCLPTELYGGPIRATWIDRELGIAGRVAMGDGSVRLVRLEGAAIIPNLAIHLNRKVNEGFEYNAQDHLVAVYGVNPQESDGKAGDVLKERVADACGADVASIAEVELLLFDASEGALLGHDRSLYASSRVDNLAGCFTNLEAFLRTAADAPRVLMLYNHEEIGSLSGEGAQSGLLSRLMRRLVTSAGGDEEDLEIVLAQSTVVSNDAAHAIHPSFKDKHDPDYAPLLGGGPVLKLNGMYRYATTAAGAAGFARACDRAGVVLQRMSNRSDLPSGSTVGPVTWARTGIATVDVGIPILAMHSIRETGGSEDVESMIRALSSYCEGTDDS